MTKVAIIGTGLVAQRAYLPNLKNKNIKKILISDLETELLKKVSKKFKIKDSYLNHKKLIESNKPDCAIVLVNRKATEKVTQYLLKKKIPLITEKPQAQSHKVAIKLNNLAKKLKVPYYVAYMKRCDEGINWLKTNLNKQNLGKIQSVYYESRGGDSYGKNLKFISHKDKNYQKKNTLNKKKLTKKQIYLKYLNTFCHSINLLNYIFGKIDVKYKNINSQGEGTVLFKNKKFDILFSSQFISSSKWREKISIYFDYGKLSIYLPKPLEKKENSKIFIENYKRNIIKKVKLNKSWSFKNQLDCLIKKIKKKKTKFNLCNSNEALKDIKLIDRIFKK